MSFDPDDNLEDEPLSDELKQVDKLLAFLDDCDLGDWDRNFVEDMVKRIAKYGNRITITARQHDQLDRMERQYLG